MKNNNKLTKPTEISNPPETKTFFFLRSPQGSQNIESFQKMGLEKN